MLKTARENFTCAPVPKTAARRVLFVGVSEKKIKHALLAAAVFSALLAATLPLAHTAWLKWPVDFGTAAVSDDLVEARALTKEACGDSSQWGQVLCQNAKGIVSALERHAP